MKIAQVSPLYESVPPCQYGGTERIVSYLTEELIRQGHEVTLFASGDSKTSAKLIAPCRRALRRDPECRDPLAAHIVMIEEVFRRAAEFDVIHFHIDYLHFPYSIRMGTPAVTTLHGRLDIPDLAPLHRTFRGPSLISISTAQRVPLPWVNWIGTVHHGLPEDLYSLETAPDPYLVFVGRISPEKGLDKAIEIARQSGMLLKIGAKIDAVDRNYYESEIRPLLTGSGVEFLGEVSDREKQQLIGKASALLFPVNWPEPFGIVMLEAMACGTPVIAFPRGSVSEVLDNGANGYIANDVSEAVNAVKLLPSFDRAACRKVFEKRFSARRMTKSYLDLYRTLVRSKTTETVAEVPQCL